MPRRFPAKEECLGRISDALGRKVRPSEAEDMLKGMYRAMSSARERLGDDWFAMSDQERLDAGADILKEWVKERAAKLRQRTRLTVLVQDKLNRAWQRHRERGRYGLSGVQAILEEVSRRANAMRSEYVTKFAEPLKNKIPGLLFADKRFEAAVVLETYGVDTQNENAKLVAEKFREVSEATRKRINSAGGDIRFLENYLPQNHNVSRMVHATEVLAGQGRIKQLSNAIRNTFGDKVNRFEANKKAWSEYVFGLLDRDKYGELSDAELRDMLGEAYTKIITDGDQSYDVSLVAGQNGGKSFTTRADRGNQARVLHFRGPEEFFQYRQMFGQGSLLDSMMGTISQRAKDIALLEELGPSPNTMVAGMIRVGEADVRQGNMVQGVLKNPLSVHMVDASWSVLNGDATRIAPGRELIAAVFQGARNMEIVGKLQSTFINSLSDLSSYFVAANCSHIPFFRAAGTLFTSLGKDNRALMARGGLLADSLSSSLSRWAESNVGQGWTGMLANATMKASLLDAWTFAVRRAAMQNHMGMLADMTHMWVVKIDGKDLSGADIAKIHGEAFRMVKEGKIPEGATYVARPWEQVDAYTRRLLERSGVDEVAWRIWTEATPFEQGGARYLTTEDVHAVDLSKPDKIKDARLKEMVEKGEVSQRDVDRAATGLVAFLNDESGLASIGPDLFTRAATSWGQAKGTVRGEMMRSLLLFKGYPIAFMRRHLERMADLAETRGKADAVKYTALLFTTTTALAGLSVQLKELLAGRDIQNMENSQFWLEAMAVGGGVGLLTDMIVSGVDGHNAYGSPNLLRFLGPVFNAVTDTFDVGAAYFSEGIYDKEMRANAKALKLLRGHTPFVNLWYTKSIFDRAIYNDLMEMSSPGYLARVEKFQRKEKNIGYWLPQRSLTPTRAPRFDTKPPVQR